MRWPFRVILPVVFGALALVLIFWDRQIQEACWRCDTGPAFAAPLFLLQSINAPAFVAGALLTLSAFPSYGVQFVLICLWWWWFGRCVDLGFPPAAAFRLFKLWASLLGMLACFLLLAGLWVVREIFEAPAGEGSAYRLFLARAICLVVWAFALAGGCVWGAIRLVRVGRYQGLRTGLTLSGKR